MLSLVDRFRFLLLAPALALLGLASAQETDPYAKKIKGPSGEGQKAIARIQRPKEMTLDLVAAEPLLANPIAFTIDNKGRFFVAETFRLHAGVPDNRGRPWLDDELAARNVGDRLAMYKKYKYLAEASKEQDRVRLVWDSNGDGIADKAKIFADGFNDPLDGLGSGLITRGNKVWYTCIPHLWLLEDTRGDGKADVKKSLSYGYGVHVSFLGHDSHGLRFGPDGKLYFTVGDRGATIEKDGKVLINTPDTGSVFRCDPDGSNLEVYHTGLRNPQELAFNELGDLFTGDNNADGGDRARWVHIVEGGDSGWRIGYQYLKGLGPWNAEKLWHTQHAGQAGHNLPPLAHIGNGPSGLTYHPGVALLPEKYQKHFFLVDFRGGSGGSGIHAFSVDPNGASYKPKGVHNFIWSVLATDCEIGPDGAFYVLDWVEGWGMTGKGRIYKAYEKDRLKESAIEQVKTLLAEGMEKRDVDELAKLLGHADQRVRQEAQFELAHRKQVAVLAKTAKEGKGLARLHAIWGLGQTAHADASLYNGLLEDADAEVRAQTAKVLGSGQIQFKDSWPRKATESLLVKNLKDDSARVKYFSALALRHFMSPAALAGIADMLKASKGSDPYLRHAGMMAMASMDEKLLYKTTSDPNIDVRHAALLAMRKRELPGIILFLKDSEPYLVLEAARAINDQPITRAMPALAEFLTRPGVSWTTMAPEIRDPLMLRALNANYRLGGKANVEAIAKLAATGTAPSKIRVEALKMLQDWEKPFPRDKVVGMYRPLKNRPGAEAAEALKGHLAGIMTGPDEVRAEGAKVAAKHGIKEVVPMLREMAFDQKRPASIRVDTLRALEALKDANLSKLAKDVLSDDDPSVRSEGRRILLASLKPDEAVLQLEDVLKKGHPVEKQGAMDILATLKSKHADRLVGEYLDELKKGNLAPEIALDVLEAARKRGGELKKKLSAYEASYSPKDPLAKWRATLAGGNAERGRRVFFEKTDLSCVRCHQVNGVGGEVGPELKDVGAKYKRDYLLESIVTPDLHIAKGYETVVLNLVDGTVKSGVLKSEDKKEIRLVTPEGKLLVVPAEDVELRARGPSAMPADLHQKMTLRELRDLVEYLSTLK